MKNNRLLNYQTGQSTGNGLTAQPLGHAPTWRAGIVSVAATGLIEPFPGTDLSNPGTLHRLVDCLLYALAIDESTLLTKQLGMSEGLTNEEALVVWIHQETRAIRFLDGSALFHYLFRQLENLIAAPGRSL
ncbi:MAG: hypothetical protein BVN35_18530 [Proteobacteria bacterium ST_bin11]|nr:MAG: hypothetical protein BVN35_18530 [Proteobacteria bacterium ST_bin11]